MPPKSQFARDYRLPIKATVLFLLMVCGLLLLRSYEQSALADTLPDKSSTSQDYATLLSIDKEDGPKKNEVTPEDQAKVDEAKKPVADTQTPFTISPNPLPNPSPPPPSPGTTPPPPSPSPSPTPPPPSFSAEIMLMNNMGSGPLACGNGICYKTYYFNASIHTQNGPGTVHYTWDSSRDGDSNGSFTVGGGDTYTPLQKQLKLRCDQPGSFTVQLLITSPDSDKSTVTVNHECGSTAPGP